MQENDGDRAEKPAQGEEDDDLASFGALSAPDQEAGSASLPPPEASEADLAALAASIATGGDGASSRIEPAEEEDEATIDLKAAAATALPSAEPATYKWPSGPPVAKAETDAKTDTRAQTDATTTDAETVEPPSSATATVQTEALPLPTARPRPVLPLVLASFALGLGAGAAFFLADGWVKSGNSDGLTAAAIAPSARTAEGTLPPQTARAPAEPGQAAGGASAEVPVDPAPVNDSDSAEQPDPGAGAVPAAAAATGIIAVAPTEGKSRAAVRAIDKPDRRRAGAAVIEQDQNAEQPRPRSTEAQRQAVDPGTNSAGVIDELLDETLEAKPTRAGDSRAAPSRAQDTNRYDSVDLIGGSALPLTPSRQQVADSIRVLLPAIRGCAKGRSGLATARIVIRNTGRVASVTVQGDGFTGSPTGRCIEGAIRRARFPQFRQSVFRVTYPLAIGAGSRDHEIPR